MARTTAQARMIDGVFGNSLRTVTAAILIAESDRGNLITVNSASNITVDLPAAASVGDGFTTALYNINTVGIVTIDPNLAELVNTVATVALTPKQFVILTTDGLTWTALIASVSITGSFVSQVNGGTGGSNSTFLYEIHDRLVHIHSAGSSNVVTSTTTSMQLTGLPTAIRPVTQIIVPCITVDNGITVFKSSHARIAAGGTLIQFAVDDPLSETGYTGSNTKGLPSGWSIVYPLT